MLLCCLLLSLKKHQLVRRELADVGLLGCLYKQLSVVLELGLVGLLNIEKCLLSLLDCVGLRKVIERWHELHDSWLLRWQDVNGNLRHVWLLGLFRLLKLLHLELL